MFEAWPYSTGIGGGLQIAPNGMHVLAEIGLADEMIRRGSVARILRFLFAVGQPARLDQPQHEGAFRPARGQHVPRHAERDALVNKAWCDNVELHFEKRLARIEDRADQPVVAHFTDGTSAEGDFVIGADGVHSAVRDACDPRRAKTVRHRPDRLRRLRAAIADRGFWRSGSASTTTFGQSGFFGYGFCSPDPGTALMWWSTQPSHGVDAATFRAMSQDAMRQHLRDFHAGWHDPIPRILDAAENIVVTDTLDVATLPTWSRKRTLLIGDAAHATSPHAGQGASLALEDAMRLGRLMLDRPGTWR